MSIECVMICLDNSDWMRNGDYSPTRIDAQRDAARMICKERMLARQENTVGILTTSGKGVNLLVSPTGNEGEILACFQDIRIGGKSDFPTGIQVACLALKHRKVKEGVSRVVIFVGSPILSTPEQLKKLAKEVKKSNVAVDVIALGDIEGNQSKLTDFITEVNKNDNSHLVVVPPGVPPSEALRSSPVLPTQLGSSSYGGGTLGGSGGGAGSGGGGGMDDFGGVDPTLDPELAMVLRMSAEEARRSQPESSSSASSSTVPTTGSTGGGGEAEMDEEALFQMALQLSLSEFSTSSSSSSSTEPGPTPTTPAIPTTPTTTPPSSSEGQGQTSVGEGGSEGREGGQTMDEVEGEGEEDDALMMALQMSMAQSSSSSSSSSTTTPSTTTPSATSSSSSSSSSSSALPVDVSFLSELVGSVEGVDLTDPLILEALAQITGNNGGGGGGGEEGGGQQNKKRKDPEEGDEK